MYFSNSNANNSICALNSQDNIVCKNIFDRDIAVMNNLAVAKRNIQHKKGESCAAIEFTVSFCSQNSIDFFEFRTIDISMINDFRLVAMVIFSRRVSHLSMPCQNWWIKIFSARWLNSNLTPMLYGRCANRIGWTPNNCPYQWINDWYNFFFFARSEVLVMWKETLRMKALAKKMITTITMMMTKTSELSILSLSKNTIAHSIWMLIFQVDHESRQKHRRARPPSSPWRWESKSNS